MDNFRFECEMAPIARHWLEESGLSVKAEFQTRWGVCDFVGMSLKLSKVQHRLRLGQIRPIGPELRVSLLNSIPDVETGRSATFRALQSEFGIVLSPGELENQLRHLRAGRFITSPRRNSFQKVNGWAPLHKRIVCVELKLSRVEEALFQASCNLRFATESYVGLPRQLAERIVLGTRIQRFKDAGVGIIAVGSHGCDILLRAKRSLGADTVYQMHCVERFWRTGITSSSS